MYIYESPYSFIMHAQPKHPKYLGVCLFACCFSEIVYLVSQLEYDFVCSIFILIWINKFVKFHKMHSW